MVKTPGVTRTNVTSPVPQIWGFYRTIESRFGPSTSTPKKPRENCSTRSVPVKPPETWNIDLSPQLHLNNMIPLFKAEHTSENKDSSTLPIDLVSIWSKRHEKLKMENEELRRVIRSRDKTIKELTALVKALNSEVDSSGNDKSSSTTCSNLPVVRVTPQKRTHIMKQSRDSSSPRRNPSRQLDMGRQQIEVGTVHNRPTHTFQERSRNILRNAGIESDALSSSTAVTVDSTSVSHHHRNTRDSQSRNSQFANRTFPINNRSIILSRTLSEDPCSPSTVNNSKSLSSKSVPQRLTQTFVIESLSSSRDDRHPDWVDPQSPAFYLRMKRPDFIRRLEHRQAVIKAASASRKQIESRRRNAARALVQGQISMGSARSALFADPTEVKAFPQKDMKAITKRRMSSTDEYRRGIRERQIRLDKAANHIISYCYSQNTKNLHRSNSQPVLRN